MASRWSILTLKTKHDYTKIPDNYHVSEDGVITNLKTNNILKGNRSSEGYLTVDFYPDGRNGKRQKRYIHRLVATKFIPIPDGMNLDELDVNHKDGVKHHNCVQNLEWVTRSGNIKHAYSMGLAKQSGCKIIASGANGDEHVFGSYKEAADHFGVNVHCIRDRLVPSGKNTPLTGFVLRKKE